MKCRMLASLCILQANVNGLIAQVFYYQMSMFVKLEMSEWQ